ncbi:MAG: muconolactone Delta-isomerase family protein [Prochloraceae cyanobacterium]|nr:muconolactone Delta-isomerase family protein [Prochloraceae cyanobacterium]
MLYHLDFIVSYPTNMSQFELFVISIEEANAALKAKHQGTIIDLWKCVGTPRIIAIIDVESPDALDRILMDLPIVKKHGQHVEIEVTPLRRYEDFAEDMKTRINLS